ncbi:Oligoendopeptidase F, plasmid [Paenibacillus sp. CECT 9249]|uniref:M3 family oligoendopeptidase n=1 Tax=Paenibacillus sp. CECT 9249 TaxID=2845385 RepID=UPI001E4E7FEC|nr:M3 family oligoendopeptidase [Paenibacillus sp. CECT 9249]CAH0118304.1 Oligoendopeptidase F, plasmid [Paenibacillus sp. CECT 9249]
MKQPLQPTWDLDSIFAGGSGSAPFASFLQTLQEDLSSLQQQFKEFQLPRNVEETGKLNELLDRIQSAMQRLREASAFTECLTAENQKDRQAVLLTGRVKSINAQLLAAFTRFDEILSKMDEQVWNAWLETAEVKPLAFNLNERREQARDKLPPEQEALAGDLAVDGYHGWGEFYNTLVSRIRIPSTEDGKTVHWSAGQASNKMHDPDPEVRSRIFKQWEQTWGEQADLFADTLNYMAGFRLKLYEHRGWDSVLKESLEINRMSEQTLQVMWDVIVRSKPVFVQYLQRKAKLLGKDKLSWEDVEAPVGSLHKKVSYDEAAQSIVEQFRKFSPKMADFSVRAFEERWIEAEDRPGKRPGGFCTSLPVSRQTRIFLTFAGTPSNVSTLAHELGHGYHQLVMDDLPALSQEYAMNVAETASTLAEAIMMDSTLKQAESDEERIVLLDEKIQNSIAFYMNIHARFLFETRFYELRKQGLVGADRLCELMAEAQKEAYCDALSEYHPHFWASKLHFYITDVPFYNFPYTFGYLFSAGIYAEALRRGAGFEEQYIDLLRDTGRMTVEQLAQKHLGVDLTKPDFWQSAVDLTVNDVREFLQITE